MKNQIAAVPRRGSERFAAAAGKIGARLICEPGVLAKTGSDNYFAGGNKQNECSAAGPGVLNSPQAKTMGSDCKVPSHRSPLHDCQSKEKLLAIVPSV
jgi:hypothetical protein